MKYDLITENWYNFINEEVTTTPLAAPGDQTKPTETTTGQSEEEKRQAQKDTMLGSFENQLHDLSTTAKKLGFASTELKADLIKKINDLIKESKKKKSGDRCTRIAKRKYKVWPSAYASGAVVKCRQGKIWKGISENATDEEIDYALLLEQLESIEVIEEKWSEKYKRSINCKHPKGFSQKAHCQGRKKNEELELDKDVIEEQNFAVVHNQPKFQQILNQLGLHRYSNEVKYLRKYDEFCDFGYEIQVKQYLIILKVCSENQIKAGNQFWDAVKNELKSMIQSGSIVNESKKKDYKPNFSKEKEQGLHGWFARNKGKGWINCRTGGPCGRSDSDEGGKYPACRPTKAQCKSAGKGPLRKKKSSKPISWTKKKKKD
jgi:hypothetical protein